MYNFLEEDLLIIHTPNLPLYMNICVYVYMYVYAHIHTFMHICIYFLDEHFKLRLAKGSTVSLLYSSHKNKAVPVSPVRPGGLATLCSAHMGLRICLTF